jgi:hypothetical protein
MNELCGMIMPPILGNDAPEWPAFVRPCIAVFNTVAAGLAQATRRSLSDQQFTAIFGSRSPGFLAANQLHSAPVVPVGALLKNPGALGAPDAKLAEIAEALPHLPLPAIEIILPTVRAFRG